MSEFVTIAATACIAETIEDGSMVNPEYNNKLD
jgi:hypothetical protein